MEEYVYQEMAEVEKTHWWYKARREIIKSELQKLNLPNNAKILEVGCGTGGNLDMLAEFGEVVGLEPNEFARKYIKETKKIQVESCYLPKKLPPLKAEEFDVIAMFDVLEHIEEDEETISCLKKYLKKNGYFILTVPAYQFLWSHHDVINHHKRRYVVKELVTIAQQENLTILKKSYFDFFLFPLIFALRTFHTLLGKKVEYAKMPNRLLGYLFYKIFSMERILLKYLRLPFGVSIMFVARKNN